jgi:hypothetical protein
MKPFSKIRYQMLLALVALYIPCQCLATKQLVIVQDGVSAYVVAIPTKPTDAEKHAAEELTAYIKKISHVELRLQGVGARVGNAIILRRAAGITAGKSGFIRPEDDAFSIDSSADGDIILEGNSDRAVLHAAYEFLTQLGCRFLAPQFDHYHGTAEVIPTTPTLTWLVRSMHTQPVFAYRKLYVEEGHSQNEKNLRQLIEWMPKAGYNVLVVPADYQGAGRVKWDTWRIALTPELQKRGIVIEVGGHGYQNFINSDMPAPDADGKTLFDAHPDWFAIDQNGARRREHNWVLNSANPQAVQFMAANMLKYIQDRPEIQIFDMWPPDGERWDESEQGRKQGSSTDRMVLLTNLVREEMVKVRPDIRLECIAYSRYVQPPVLQHLHKDILVDFCPSGQSFEAPFDDPSNSYNTRYSRGLAGWRQGFDGDISIYSYYRKYIWQSLPVILPHYFQQDLKFFQSSRLQGISTFSEPGDWFTYELNHYMLAKIAWNPNTDVDVLIQDFCSARYGPAAKAASTVLHELEETVRRFGSIPSTPLKSPERIQAARDSLAQAATALNGLPSAATDLSVQRLGLDCEYALRDLDVQLIRAHHESDEKFRAAVSAMHLFVVQHGDEGIFLIDGGRLSEAGLLRRYGVMAPNN